MFLSNKIFWEHSLLAFILSFVICDSGTLWLLIFFFSSEFYDIISIYIKEKRTFWVNDKDSETSASMPLILQKEERFFYPVHG